MVMSKTQTAVSKIRTVNLGKSMNYEGNIKTGLGNNIASNSCLLSVVGC